VVAGVAGSLAERLDVDPVVIRLALVVLAFAGGFGLVAYLFLWLIGSEPAPGAEVAQMEERTRSEPGVRQAVAVGLVVTGVLLVLREAGLWFGDALEWSVALAAFGSAIIWTRSDDSGRARFTRLTSRIPRSPTDALAGSTVSRGRLALGGLLVLAGMATFLVANGTLAALRNVVFAVIVTVTGLGLILGPWMWQLVRQLADERRERVRQEERAEVAAHLHDSVLQTLAMIQRSSSPQQMATLARGQERELRAWLYGRTRPAPTGPQALSEAIDEMAGRAERLHSVIVEAIAVGDAPMDERLRALVDAAGEAVSNAAKHSGATAVSVYVEVGQEAVSVYVRDEGNGFDAEHLPPDRRGIAESIVGRMERHGGAATVQSEPREGTEVHLRMPRRTAQ
jgi:signal transduction histidine kinase